MSGIDRGTIIVTGSNSLLTVGAGLRVANNGIGVLTVAEGGHVSTASAPLELGWTNGNGTLNIGTFGANGGAGTVNAGGGIWFGNGGAWTQAQIDGTSAAPIGGATLNFNHSASGYVLGADLRSRDPLGTHVIHSLASINHLGTGHTTLTGNVIDVRGNVAINAGTLSFAGLQHYGLNESNQTVLKAGMEITGNVNVGTGGTLGIGERIARTTTHALYVTGDLTMASGAFLEMGIGTPGADLNLSTGSISDVIHVGGALTLNGTLNLYDLGNGSGGQGIGFGRYELFTYGSLVGNNMEVGSMPHGLPGTLQNDSSNQRILLVVEQALGDSAWWGVGDGVWNSTVENWSALESREEPLFGWNDGTAIFNGAGGTVTVAEDVHFAEIAFEANGYVLANGGGNVVGKPVEAEQTIVNLSAATNVTGEIATGLREFSTGPALQMRKYGNGTVILSSDNNLWTGGTNLEAGILQIGSGVGGGTTGNLPGNVINGGILRFNRSNAYTYGGIISAGGQVEQTGNGTTILTGNNSYSGLTTISSGTLQIGNASQGQNTGNIGNGAVSIGANGTLAFDRLGDYSFGNTITGSGKLAQDGGGELSLTGNLSGFTGDLLARNGRIRFGSATSYAGKVTVADGGVFGGTGTVGSITVESGGRLAPGNSIGILTVNGNLIFQTDSVYEVEASNLPINAPAADLVNVIGTGDVTLNGTVQVVGAPDDQTVWHPLNTYTILTYTGSRSGTEFADVEVVKRDGNGQVSPLAFLTPSLDYGTGVVTLRLDRNDIAFAELEGATPNQRAAGGALETLGFEHTVALAGVPLYDEVQGMTRADALAAFDALSGEIHASVVGMLLDDSRLLRDTVLRQAASASGRDDGGRYWLHALGHQGKAEGSGVSRLQRDAVGLMVGRDHVTGEGAINLGWALGYHTNASTEVQSLGSTGEVKNAHAALYGGTRLGSGLGLRLGTSYSWHETDIARQVTFVGYGENVKTGYDGATLQAFGEVDLELKLGGVEVAPYAGLAWARLSMDGFQEADFRSPIGRTAALEAGRQTHEASFATMGGRAGIQVGEGLNLRGLLGYRRVLNGEDPTVRLAFLDGGQHFEVAGVPVAQDALLADLGLELALSDKIRIGAAYNGQLAKDATDHAVQARFVWMLE